MRATLLYKQYRLTLQTRELMEGLSRGVTRTELKPSALSDTLLSAGPGSLEKAFANKPGKSPPGRAIPKNPP